MSNISSLCAIAGMALGLGGCAGPPHDSVSDWKKLCSTSAEKSIRRTVDGVDGFLYQRESRLVNLETGAQSASVWPPRPYYSYLWDGGRTGYRFTEYARDQTGLYRASMAPRSAPECNIPLSRETNAIALDGNGCVYESKVQAAASAYKLSEIDISYGRNCDGKLCVVQGLSSRQITITDLRTGKVIANQIGHQLSWSETNIKAKDAAAYALLFPMSLYLGTPHISKQTSCTDREGPMSENGLVMLRPSDVLKPIDATK